MTPSNYLHPDLLTEKPLMRPTRDGFGEGLHDLGEQNPQVVALCADLTESTRMQAFAEAYPHRFVQVGVAEQNMATVASGMAAMGKIPFIASYAMFSPGRNWEQIRTTIAYNDRPVKIIGAHAGISVGPDGATHQAIEDIALMRVMPNMVVVAPCDAIEARKATLAIAAYKGPVYMRLGREKTPLVTNDDTPFVIGKAMTLLTRDTAHTKKLGIIATGTVVANAVRAARTLNVAGIGASVLHVATIKPLDEDAVRAFAEEHDALITVEEHQIAGGLGSAVAEYLAAARPTRIVFLGVHDTFGQSGEPDELLEHYGMSEKAIIAAAQKLFA
ncbi:transketolase [Candidatus Kaiserbacteria bacterium RIFCSPHIGHO2_02_FULL_50_50]|uniref:Transketolase n=1 Tax=Candidatus Kaiserbacteria bacterium RIFCSPHIGHO2_02_FULL_50_50 TaxID=1798492 RepID=A0A1F6DFT6_9BACT|nr:MAG: transketolase [Candidatus Kaiserbacteria bacterium RIFCSPHIGHO2_02_FULL_50_50]OGG88916.1 MAG: transketolase [Candidatus Kaiserbacteria bacterium RIFCSPLOWO2_12_FULL_50_10]